MPHPCLEPGRFGVENSRLRPKAQGDPHATPTSFVCLADLPLVVGVIDVFFVEQETAQVIGKFRLRVDPHFKS